MKIILECLNEPSFSKCLDLDSRITIGRQIPPKSLAEPTNGIFDSKVLSRYHAEIYLQDSVLYIRDLNSSNGTFVNENSISNPAGKVGDPHPLKHLDVIEFGIDIPDDDGNDLYKKVVCKVVIVDQVNELANEESTNVTTHVQGAKTNDDVGAKDDFGKLTENEKLERISSLINQELKEIQDSKSLYKEYGQDSSLKEIYRNHQELKEFCQNAFQEIKEQQAQVKNTQDSMNLEQIQDSLKVLQDKTQENSIEIIKLRKQVKWDGRIQNLLILGLSFGGVLLLKKFSKL